MNPGRASAYRAAEHVVVRLRLMRPRLRFVGTTLEHGVRRVHVTGGTPGEWADLLLSLDRADAAKADAELAFRHDIPRRDAALRERPLTVRRRG